MSEGTNKKLHRTQLRALSAALWEVFSQRSMPEQALSASIRANRKLGSRDRSIISEFFFELLRHWRKAWNGLEKNWDGSDATLEEMAARFFFGQSPESDDWTITQSVSSECDSLGMAELGTVRWRAELEAMNRPADIFLRPNTLKTDANTLLRSLAAMGIETDLVERGILRSRKRIPLQGNTCFEQGHFEIQDLSSQRVIPFLDPKPGETMIDWCAGAGGKSLHAAAYMKNQGRIIATDASSGRLKKLGERKVRGGADCIEIMELSKVLASGILADKVLVDAPCTGSGVIRREPVKKYFINETEVKKYTDLQKEILRKAGVHVVKGGVLVYCTCSIFPSENNAQIEGFLSSHDDWSLVDEKMFWPSDTEGDGFYMARIKKNT